MDALVEDWLGAEEESRGISNSNMAGGGNQGIRGIGEAAGIGAIAPNMRNEAQENATQIASLAAPAVASSLTSGALGGALTGMGASAAVAPALAAAAPIALPLMAMGLFNDGANSEDTKRVAANQTALPSWMIPFMNADLADNNALKRYRENFSTLERNPDFISTGESLSGKGVPNISSLPKEYIEERLGGTIGSPEAMTSPLSLGDKIALYQSNTTPEDGNMTTTWLGPKGYGYSGMSGQGMGNYREGDDFYYGHSRAAKTPEAPVVNPRPATITAPLGDPMNSKIVFNNPKEEKETPLKLSFKFNKGTHKVAGMDPHKYNHGTMYAGGPLSDRDMKNMEFQQKMQHKEEIHQANINSKYSSNN